MRRLPIAPSGALLAFFALTQLGLPAAAAPPCSPCAGFDTDDPAAAAQLLSAAPALAEGSVLWVRWQPIDDEQGAAAAVRAAGGTPWLAFAFATPSPLLDHLTALESELEQLASLAATTQPGERIQLLWPSGGSRPQAVEYGFLVKRASVAITGVAPEVEVVSAPLAADSGYLAELFDQDVAAYLDGVALEAAEPEAVADAAERLQQLDPGIAVILETAAPAGDPGELLAAAAASVARGAGTILFTDLTAAAEPVAALGVLAREFSGDRSLDPYSQPQGAVAAWSFVRGEDLGLRVVARAPDGAERMRLVFPDRNLRLPELIDLATGEPVPQFLTERGDDYYAVEISSPPPVVLLALERPGAGEIQGLEGVEEALTVRGERQVPVEEILRRLQAFEDAQRRRVGSYSATNTTHLRFQAGTGGQSFEATFRGPFFFRQGGGFDWVWQELLVNGVRWRDKTVPEIPLIQPAKAAAQPVEISFGKEYRYSLRGTATVEGRDCWVVEFAPTAPAEPGRSLYQGTLWVDRELYARVKTRAVQLGLTGEVVSNEEAVTFSPLTADGQAAPWAAGSYFLPVRLVGQQIWSLLSSTTVVEREIVLTEVEINPPDFAARRQAALDSEYTMVRDTTRGLRYLVPDKESGERVVKEDLDPKRRFLVGGLFYDDSQDFPIPLAGMNWLWFDWRDTGTQVNVFSGGVLLSVAVSNPSLFGGKTDAGFDLFALAVPGSDLVFEGDRELTGEKVQRVSPNIDLKLGRPIGSFVKLGLEYELGYTKYTRADETDPDFTLPSDHLSHTLTLFARYNRRGYRARLQGSYARRDEWQPWGLPGNPGYDPDHKEYRLWGAALGKTWHLPKFFKIGAEVEYLDGTNLDRFSKYEFGYFSDVRVHGYQSNKVRAEEALAAHLTYGFDVASVLRLDLVADAAWATDAASGLDRELLGGVGISGTLVGPWRTVINIDLGAAVAGPDDGFSLFVAVLKLFKR